MKKISLQWRITLMTVLLIGVTCVAMNLLLCSSGIYYMDSIADTLQGSDRILLDEEDTISFDPQVAAPDGELTADVFRQRLTEACPALADAPMLWRPSCSAHSAKNLRMPQMGRSM